MVRTPFPLNTRPSILFILSVLIPISVDAQTRFSGYRPKVRVQQQTRLDWVFALANQSPPRTPPGWLDGYDSTKQTYELYVPPRKNDEPRALILFISPSEKAMGWKSWQAVCQQKGIVFAGPNDAGNNCKIQRRVRIVMDVLDDVRRRVKIDPDRTYISGFSGGGRIACSIGFSLTEYFGGVIPICAGGELRQESWLRHRVIDRLSVAMLTGENDFNRGEVERFRGPLLQEVGVRTRVWVVPKLGHRMPQSNTLSDAFDWLEEATAARRAFARKFPIARIDATSPANRKSWSSELLAEAKSRMKDPKSQYSGLMQLKGIMVRWPDTKAGIEAKKVLLDYDSRPQRPWEKDDIAEQRLFLIAQARGLDAYASGPIAKQYANQRGAMAQAAINLWKLVINDGQDSKAVSQAKSRIPKLQAIVDSKSPK